MSKLFGSFWGNRASNADEMKEGYDSDEDALLEQRKTMEAAKQLMQQRKVIEEIKSKEREEVKLFIPSLDVKN